MDRIAKSKAEWAEQQLALSSFFGFDVEERKYQWIMTLLYNIDEEQWENYLAAACQCLMLIQEVRPPITSTDIVHCWTADTDEYEGQPRVIRREAFIGEFKGHAHSAIGTMDWRNTCGSFGIVVSVMGRSGGVSFVLQDWHRIP